MSALFATPFDVWYAAYPRKEKRKDALKAWDALNPTDELAAEMTVSVEKHCATIWRGRQTKYIPLPATFIRGEQWSDDCSTTPDPDGPRKGVVDDRLAPPDAYERAFLRSIGAKA